MLDQRSSNSRGWDGALWVLAGLILLLGLARPSPASALPAGFQDEIVISDLSLPTSVRFSPDGRVFVAEKRGVIKVYDSLSDTTPTTFADLRSRVYDFWDRGLLGLELHPSFPSQPYVYALYSLDAPIGGSAPIWNDDCPDPPGANSDGCLGGARLAKLTASGNVMTGSEQVLIEDWCIQFTTHSIGELQFGPDGALYVSGGDGAGYLGVDYGQLGDPENPCGDPPGGVGGDQTPPGAEGGALRSQDLRTTADPTGLNGTILRLNPDTGAAMPDNPLAGSSDPNAGRILAYGMRNPFRFTFRPGTSEIWFGDVGMDEWEEINRLQSPLTAPVENFGWPCYEGSGRHPGYDNTDLTLCEGLYAETGAVTAPYYSYPHSGQVVPGESCPSGGASTSGVAFYPGGSYPDSYDGALFFADYSRSCIWAMPTNGGTLPDPGSRFTFGPGSQGPVQLQIGPGGDLYYVSIGGGAIHRISYTPGNQPPTARATADPTSGPVPLEVDFDARSSTDAENDPLSFAWDLDGDGQYDDSTDDNPTWTYDDPGTHNASVRVRDPGGGTSFASVTVTAGGSPPTASIDSPSPSLAWEVGDLIQFSGSGTDDQDGDLGASSFSWAIDLHHCPSSCHVHTVRQVDDVLGSSFSAPDHDYPSFITIRLTVTDSDGLTASDEVRLDPQTTQLTLHSTPPGLQIGFDSSIAAAPFTRTVIVGSRHSISAPAPQTLGGSSYAFSSWSDGESQAHDVTVSSPTSLTAQYQATATAPGPSLGAGLLSNALAPNTLIRHGPRGGTNDRTPTFRFRSQPPGAAFACRLDSAPWTACASPLTLGQLSFGPHVFRVRGVGPRGLFDLTPAKRRFRVVAGSTAAQRVSRDPEQVAERTEQRTRLVEQWRRVANQLNQFAHRRALCQLPQPVGEQRI